MVAFTVAVSAALQVAAAALSPEPQRPLATWQAPGATVQAAPAPTVPAPGPRVILRFQPLPQLQAPGPDTPSLRPRAVEHSDQYYTRLTIHRIGSYAMVPLFAAEYVVGQKLANGSTTSDGLRGAHNALAVGVVGLFGLNTVTGVWNLWDSRQDSNGRARRWVHSIAMLTADGGFAATALLTPRRQRFRTGVGFTQRGNVSIATHRGIAVGSMALATASTLMMWLWK